MSNDKIDAPGAGPSGGVSREDRLSAALRENLKRRKAQSRQRQQDANPSHSSHSDGEKKGGTVPEMDKNSHD